MNNRRYTGTKLDDTVFIDGICKSILTKKIGLKDPDTIELCTSLAKIFAFKLSSINVKGSYATFAGSNSQMLVGMIYRKDLFTRKTLTDLEVIEHVQNVFRRKYPDQEIDIQKVGFVTDVGNYKLCVFSIVTVLIENHKSSW